METNQDAAGLQETRFVFVTGGVLSSVGKGLTAAALGALLQARGFRVKLKKLDPYLNVDPGTMNPNEHGEVYVTDDGRETDMDLGHYERFTGINSKCNEYITSGELYCKVIEAERRGEYLGGTVQVIPHLTDAIKEFIMADTDNIDFAICEIGGTVGDIEGFPFFEAIRQFGYEFGFDKVLYIHLTLVPYISSAKELKTKPTQHSVKELRSIGIQPNILVCRADREIPIAERQKIALFCNVKDKCVIQGLDQKSIYQIPIAYHEQGLDREVLAYFGLPHYIDPPLTQWREIIENLETPIGEIKLAMVAKYDKQKEAYKSLVEALDHAGIANKYTVQIVWIDSVTVTEENIAEKVTGCHAILIPGGFGYRGAEGKILAIKYAREHNIPFLGICLGMQLAVIEIARNILNINDAISSEFSDIGTKVIGIMTEWLDQSQSTKITRDHNTDMGGTMRLGAYSCTIQPGTLASNIYGTSSIDERHRHRYEVNTNYKKQLEQAGVVFSGVSPCGNLMEMLELPELRWFIGVQCHPEFKSRPFSPHPLFVSFIKAAIEFKNL